MLRRYFSSRRDNVAVLLLRRCYNSQQRRKAAHYATMASDFSARGNGKQGNAALQRWQVASAEIFILFYFFTREFQRENESKKERKETGL
jgi:hypothetical protein